MSLKRKIIALMLCVSICLFCGLGAFNAYAEAEASNNIGISVGTKSEEIVKIYVLAASESDYYSSGYLQYYYSKQGISAPNDEYYQQAVEVLDIFYGKEKVIYIDPNETATVEFLNKYPAESFNYGDILVTFNYVSSGKEISNYCHLTVHDIYSLEDPTGMAAYGMGDYYINDCILRSSLTKALKSVRSNFGTIEVAYINEKSTSGVFDYFKNILEQKGCVVENVGISKPIPSEYDIAVICAPTTDFSKEELDVLSIFLENGGKLGKTLLFYGESTNQNLPNFYNFLAEWGIGVESGIVVETSDTLCLPDDRSTYISFGKTGAPFTVSQEFLSGFNIPMYERGEGEAYNGRTTTTFIGTNGTSAIVPIDTDISTLSVEGLERRALSTAIISTEEDYDNEAKESIFSHVIAFSSYDYISEYYIEGYKSLTNYTGATLNAVRYAVGYDNVTDNFGVVIIGDAQTQAIKGNDDVADEKPNYLIRIVICAVVVAVLSVIVAVFVVIKSKKKFNQ